MRTMFLICTPNMPYINCRQKEKIARDIRRLVRHCRRSDQCNWRGRHSSQRYIYDRPPIMNWGRGRVTLLGDSVHAMQPNLGQAGCMAIEVCYLISFPWLWNHYHHGGYVVVLRSGTYHNSIVFAGWLPAGCRAWECLAGERQVWSSYGHSFLPEAVITLKCCTPTEPLCKMF